MTLAWNNSLELGVQEIDAQHREIFKYFEQLSCTCHGGHEEGVLEEVLTFLDNYVAHHFSNEEALMAQHHYPKLTEQQEQHASFRKEIEDLRNRSRIAGQGRELALDIYRKLIRWLIQHIRSSDRELAEYITAHPT